MSVATFGPQSVFGTPVQQARAAAPEKRTPYGETFDEEEFAAGVDARSFWLNACDLLLESHRQSSIELLQRTLRKDPPTYESVSRFFPASASCTVAPEVGLIRALLRDQCDVHIDDFQCGPSALGTFLMALDTGFVCDDIVMPAAPRVRRLTFRSDSCSELGRLAGMTSLECLEVHGVFSTALIEALPPTLQSLTLDTAGYGPTRPEASVLDHFSLLGNQLSGMAALKALAVISPSPNYFAPMEVQKQYLTHLTTACVSPPALQRLLMVSVDWSVVALRPSIHTVALLSGASGLDGLSQCPHVKHLDLRFGDSDVHTLAAESLRPASALSSLRLTVHESGSLPPRRTHDPSPPWSLERLTTVMEHIPAAQKSVRWVALGNEIEENRMAVYADVLCDDIGVRKRQSRGLPEEMAFVGKGSGWTVFEHARVMGGPMAVVPVDADDFASLVTLIKLNRRKASWEEFGIPDIENEWERLLFSGMEEWHAPGSTVKKLAALVRVCNKYGNQPLLEQLSKASARHFAQKTYFDTDRGDSINYAVEDLTNRRRRLFGSSWDGS